MKLKQNFYQSLFTILIIVAFSHQANLYAKVKIPNYNVFLLGKRSYIASDTSYLITSKEAFFFSNPDSNYRTRKYLINGNIIAGEREYKGFIYSVFKNNKGITTAGWISRKSLSIDSNQNSEAKNLSSESQTDDNNNYLGLTGIIFALENSHYSHEMVVLTLHQFNPKWQYKSTDNQTGEVFYLTNSVKKEFLDWHSFESALEYITEDRNHFVELRNVMQTFGFRLISNSSSKGTQRALYANYKYAIQLSVTELTRNKKGYSLIIKKVN